MIQKVFLNTLTIALFVSLIVINMPSPVHAEQEPNVVDWLNEEQPTGKQDVEEKQDDVEFNNTEEKSPLLLIGQLIFYTLIILVLIYALIKFLAIRQKKLQPNQAVKMLGGTPLGNNKSLQLIKVGGKVYLIGVADHITLIKEFTSADEISSIEKDIEQQPFLLTNPLFSRSKKEANNVSQTSKTGEFEQLFNQSLNRQKVKKQQLEHELFEEENEEEGRST